MVGYVAGFLKLCTIYHELLFSVTVRDASFFVLLPSFSLTDPQGSVVCFLATTSYFDLYMLGPVVPRGPDRCPFPS